MTNGLYVKVHIVVLEFQVSLHSVALHFRHESEVHFLPSWKNLPPPVMNPFEPGWLTVMWTVAISDTRCRLDPVGESVFAIEVRRRL